MSIELDPTMAQQVESMGAPSRTEESASKGSDDYEFTVYENTVLRTLAWRMKGVAWITAVFATLQVVLAAIAFVADPSLIFRAAIMAGVSAILAASLFQSAREFRAITESEGSDLAHLMTALGKLSQFFFVQILVFAVGLGLVVVGLFALLMAYG
jgi:hypothetical protein